MDDPADEIAALAARIGRYDWDEVAASLDAGGWARLDGLLQPSLCDALTRLFGDARSSDRFRKHIDMGAHAYGEGEYAYFAYPLPESIECLRERLYTRLRGRANTWSQRLGLDVAYPDTLQELLARCHAAGQPRPTPLLLAYRAEGYNRMHQDVYGEVTFPLQLTCLLSQPGEDFEGGEFLVSEGRARMQTRSEVVPLLRGDGVVFANALRPVVSARGFSRAQMRHGVSRVRRGERFALGIIFHDAK